MGIVVVLFSTLIACMFETVLAFIGFWYIGSVLQAPVDNNFLWVGVCILVAAANIAVMGVGNIGAKVKPKQNRGNT